MFFILNEVCVYARMSVFFTKIRYVMQKNIVIFLILHIFIYFTVILVLNSHEVIQKSFYFLCLLNYVCVQKRFFLVDDLMGGESMQITFKFRSQFLNSILSSG